MDDLSFVSDASLVTDPYALKLEDLNPAQPALFQRDAMWPFFERLRREAPVHYTRDSEFGPYWSITKYKQIMQVEANTEAFSSDAYRGGIVIRDPEPDFIMPMFIAMDPPRHDLQRAAVNPVISPTNLARLEVLIRERASTILDRLPVGEVFDWVKHVSIELTTQMLATLFDFPQDERAKLTRWSDVATTIPGAGLIETEQQRQSELLDCLMRFTELWNERVNAPPTGDLISLMAHADATRDQTPMEYLGNLILLIVGGNDTTRNSISGGVLALNRFPDQYSKLLADPGLVPNMVPEIIRWQTPLAHMRPHRHARRGVRRPDHPRGRPRGDVVCQRQPRPGCDRQPGRVRHRARPSAPSPLVRIRPAPVPGRAAGGVAVARDVGGDPETFRPHRGDRGAASGVLVVCEGIRGDAGAHHRARIDPVNDARSSEFVPSSAATPAPAPPSAPAVR